MRALVAALLLGHAVAATALEINDATAADLDGLRGVGPGLSTPMLAERARAPFTDWADLMARVKGIGPGNATRLSAQGLRVRGQAYARPTLPASAPH